MYSTPPGDTVIMAMVPPADAGHSLTHEQVMPFLKKLESGRQREGLCVVSINLLLYHIAPLTLITLIS